MFNMSNIILVDYHSWQLRSHQNQTPGEAILIWRKAALLPLPLLSTSTAKLDFRNSFLGFVVRLILISSPYYQRFVSEDLPEYSTQVGINVLCSYRS